MSIRKIKLFMFALFANLMTFCVQAATYSVATDAYSWVVPATQTTVTWSSAACSSGATSTVGDDSASPIIPIGFTFNFGGTSYSNLRFETNGRITFVSAGNTGIPCGYAQDIPHADLLKSIVGFSQDMTFVSSSGCSAASCYAKYGTTGTAPNRQFVATWTNVPGFNNSTARYTFQIILNESDGSFEIQFNTMSHKTGKAGNGTYGYEIDTTSDYLSTSSLGVKPAGGTSVKYTMASALSTFGITAASSASTCSPQSVTITAKKSDGTTLTSWQGTVTLSTSTGHGNWSQSPLTGTLTQSVADSGSATYAFVAADNGSKTLFLANDHAETLSITAMSGSVGISSSNITFSDNVFVVATTDPTVAGKPANFSVALWKKDSSTGNCSIATGYSGSKGLKVWISRDAADPGGAAPTIGGTSIPNAIPASNNITSTFTSGTTTLATTPTDVGKWSLNVTDDGQSFAKKTVTGSSSTYIFPPFAVLVGAITNGAVSNSGATSTSGTVFAKAGQTFSAAIAGWLWSSTADLNNDGIPDSTATYAQKTAVGKTLSFAPAMTFSSGAPFYPSTPSDSPAGTGTAGSVSGSLSSVNWSGGAASASLSYSEVGSFTLNGTVSSYLGGSNLSLNNPTLVGRFTPNHFVITSPVFTNRSDLASCSSPTWTYLGETYKASFTLTAKNLAGGTTSNYTGTWAQLPIATSSTWGVYAGNIPTTGTKTNLTSRTSMQTISGTWGAGTVNVISDFITSRNTTPDGPFSTFVFGLAPTDSDGISILTAAKDMDANSDGTNDAQTVGTTALRFGRMRVSPVIGSDILPMVIPVQVDWFNGFSFAKNTGDTCISVPAAKVSLSNYGGNLQSGETTVSWSNSWSNGSTTATLSKPSGGDGLYDGFADFTVDLSASGANMTYLMDRITVSGGYSENPKARMTFGKSPGKRGVIDMRETY